MIMMNFHIFYIPVYNGLLIVALQPRAILNMRKVAMLVLLQIGKRNLKENTL
jgi:hypothetical protein